MNKNNQEILARAIQKALDSGWIPIVFGVDPLEIERRNTKFIIEGTDPRAYIYSHDFAKALWGENTWIDPVSLEVGVMRHVSPHLPIWQYHLQQMVVAENPIKYLGENL